jgi:hypothetical protein
VRFKRSIISVTITFAVRVDEWSTLRLLKVRVGCLLVVKNILLLQKLENVPLKRRGEAKKATVAALHGQLGEDLKVHAANTPEDFKQVRLKKSPRSLGATLSTAVSTSSRVGGAASGILRRGDNCFLSKSRHAILAIRHASIALVVRARRSCSFPFLAVDPSIAPLNAGATDALK